MLKQGIVTIIAYREECSRSFSVMYQQLRIDRQPEIGVVCNGGKIPASISIVMGEGKEPFTYYLMKNGDPISTGEGGAAFDFEAYNPGEYSIHVVDAAGDWADSDVVSVLSDSNELTIVRTEIDPNITSTKNASMLVEVENGKGPYIYTLLKDDLEMDSQEIYGNYASFQMNKPGWYAIHVESFEGRTAETKYIEVVDSRLRIEEQPKDVTIVYYSGTSSHTATFSVKAQGHPDHPLTYQWEQKGPGGWVRFNPSSKNTITLTERFRNETHTYYRLGMAYRCTVRDTVSGEEVTSREAQVIRPALEASGYQVGKTTEIKLSIKGGLGSYTIKKVIRKGADPWVCPLCETYDLSSKQIHVTGGDDRFSLELSITGVSNHKSRDNGGKIYHHYTYYFTIEDTLGNTTEVKVTMQSDNLESDIVFW